MGSLNYIELEIYTFARGRFTKKIKKKLLNMLIIILINQKGRGGKLLPND